MIGPGSGSANGTRAGLSGAQSFQFLFQFLVFGRAHSPGPRDGVIARPMTQGRARRECRITRMTSEMNADDMVGGSRPPGDVVRHSGAVMWQSGPWKLELRRLVDRCELQYVQMSRIPLRGWWEDAEQLMQLEKAVFLSAFIVRKLVESGRLSMQVEALAVSVTTYPARGPAMTPDPGNWEQLERFYDLHAGREESVPMRHLLNWVIHSFVFLVEERSDLAGGRVPAGFWCNSDRSKARDVVRVGWRQYRGMLDRVIADDVVSIVTLRDGHGGHVQVRSSELMDEEQRRVFNDTHRDFIAEIQARPAPRPAD